MIQKITLIDDNPLEHLIVERLCQRECAETELFFSDDGSVVLNKLCEKGVKNPQYPNVILLDLNMPKLSGWDFLKQMNRLYKQLANPVDVYILSSSLDNFDIDQAMAYPFVKDYIVKPMTTSVLRRLKNFYE